ncbi:hypothetical protein RHGRI_021317 [Rhododendron griersonianum]|uniref:Uncharacterized protein n=1 Tax=Rhododendron griersonianum TaxID=479676 RepID=A0AAV6JP97_9ERIC|nr:hypothetical protein RHGRI_021317 [Rhododendron griersonianum]
MKGAFRKAIDNVKQDYERVTQKLGLEFSFSWVTFTLAVIVLCLEVSTYVESLPHWLVRISPGNRRYHICQEAQDFIVRDAWISHPHVDRPINPAASARKLEMSSSEKTVMQQEERSKRKVLQQLKEALLKQQEEKFEVSVARK